jgi:hypothetical protein
MTESERKISFLNRYCIFKKVRNVESHKIKLEQIESDDTYNHRKSASVALLEKQDKMNLSKISDVISPDVSQSSFTAAAYLTPLNPSKITRLKRSIKIQDNGESRASASLESPLITLTQLESASESPSISLSPSPLPIPATPNLTINREPVDRVMKRKKIIIS